MDDANWILSSLEDLEDILEVADDFYTLTQVAINKEKSKLLTNTTTSTKPIPICFGSAVILIHPSFEAVRFLRVMIDINLNYSLIKKELSTHIRRFINVTKTKPITDKQFCYITNHVLFSQLLYKMRNTLLSKSACIRLN